MDNITLFYGKTNSEFSNFYHAPFVIDDVTYPTVEHYFMTEKAKLFDPEGEELKQMFDNKTPGQVKKLGRKVKNFDGSKWNGSDPVIAMNYLSSNAEAAMFVGNYNKYSQNPRLRELLLNTGNSILAEASQFDKLWGIGLWASNPNAQNIVSWKGMNKLGVILMLVRGLLRYEDLFKNMEIPEIEEHLYLPDCTQDICYDNFNDFWLSVQTCYQSRELSDLIRAWSNDNGYDYNDMLITLNLGFTAIFALPSLWIDPTLEFIDKLYGSNSQFYDGLFNLMMD